MRQTEITGFIGLEQLKYIEEIVEKREKNFHIFNKLIKENKELESINAEHMTLVSNFAYPLLFLDEERFLKYKKLFSNRVEVRPIVGGNIVEQPFFKEFMEKKGVYYHCPNARRINKLGFYFPNNPELSGEEIDYLSILLAGREPLGQLSDRNNDVRKKKALITGITGQDGSYLAEFLLDKGYEVHGIVRRTSSLNRPRLNNIYKSEHDRRKDLFLHYGDMTDSSSLIKIISEVAPDEIYNLAAQSHVHVSFEIPEYTALSDALGLLKILEVVLKLNMKHVKIYQASTSELFGKVAEIPQKETTPFNPRSPYATAKLYAYWIAKNYREAYNLFICNGILFNHESPRRGENFVSKKVINGVVSIKLGLESRISLGNLNAKRDWGYAPDYVESMWLMLQKEKPDDYVIATGESHSVREFVEKAFEFIGVKIKWEGTGLDEKAIDVETGKVVVDVDPRYFRPTEVDYLLGDYTKAKNELNWEPKVRFEELVKIMMECELMELSAKSF